MPNMSPYEAMILQSRAVEMQITAQVESNIMSLLVKEHKRIGMILDDLEYPGQIMKITQLQSAQQRIERVMDDLYGKTGYWKGRRVAVGGQFESLMVDAMEKASQAGIDGKIKAGIVLLNDVNPDLIPELPKLFGGIREDVIQKLMVRPLSDDRIFSQRLWKDKSLANNLISQTLTSGMLEGKSAVQISKDLRQFLILQGEGRAVKHGMVSKQPWNTKKITSRTMTLARTEINNAFTESQIECAKREPWNDGMKWNLSASHKVYDVCDIYATQDLYGMGKGIYPLDKVPVRHPRCWCFLTDVLKSLDEVARMLRSEMQIPEREVIRVKGAKPVKWNPKIIDRGIIKELDYKKEQREYQVFDIDNIALKINDVKDHQKQINAMVDSLRALPNEDRALIRKFYSYQIESQITKNSAIATFSPLTKQVDFWKGSLSQSISARSTILHEIGHQKSIKLFGGYIDRSATLMNEQGRLAKTFVDAVKKSGKYVTQYAERSKGYNEYFAESYAKYYSTGKITEKGSGKIIPEIQEWFETNLGKVDAIGDESWLLNK